MVLRFVEMKPRPIKTPLKTAILNEYDWSPNWLAIKFVTISC